MNLAILLSPVQRRLHDARLSFVSGHASLSTYSMTFTVLYLQRGMGSRDFRLVKPLIQVLNLELHLSVNVK